METQRHVHCTKMISSDERPAFASVMQIGAQLSYDNARRLTAWQN